MNDREKRDFQAGLDAEVDAWLRGEPTRRTFIKSFGQMTGMLADGRRRAWLRTSSAARWRRPRCSSKIRTRRWARRRPWR